MVAGSVANSGTFKVSTPSDTEIRLTRLFNAPRHLVFEAMTRVEHVSQWWGGNSGGYSMGPCEIDLRIGGAWKFVSRHPKGEAVFYGTYQEITPPSRLVFTEFYAPFPDSGSVVIADFTEENGKTRLTVTARYPSKEVRDFVLSTGMEKGAAASYDRLEEVAAKLLGTQV